MSHTSTCVFQGKKNNACEMRAKVAVFEIKMETISSYPKVDISPFSLCFSG
jgi:hypothetical protein